MLPSHLALLVKYGQVLASLRLIDVAASVLDPVELALLVGPVILRKLKAAETMFRRQDRSRVAHVGNIALSLYR